MEQTPKNKTQAIIRILERINDGVDPRILRKEAHRLISYVTPGDIAFAEQDLISRGVSARLAGQLSAAFVLIGILDAGGFDIKSKLPSAHILNLVYAEHEMVRYFLADLEEVTKKICSLEQMSDASGEFMKLAHIVEHLYAMGQHIEREEEVIFPYLRRYGWTSLCSSSNSDHGHISAEIDSLLRLTGAYEASKFRQFRVKLATLVSSFCPMVREHFYQEDNIIYPIALEVIKDPGIWQKIKEVCDEIGYCGIHL